ncbi:MAG TPA: F420-0--gamma-glutamyl ligase [Acholeplasmataceae bacterium]|nr:F420-0--gamma-glutamyl ligase [Acholeplasmataceae bacterium]
MKNIGTISLGIKAPIIKPGSDVAEIVCNSLSKAIEEDGVKLNDRDVICITESVVAISQGNFAKASDIATSIKETFNCETIGVVFPILSRNRFSMLLKGITLGTKNLVLQLSYPGDEVGNKLIKETDLINLNINPYQDSFTLEEFRKLFPSTPHQFTGIDYVDYYHEIIGENGKIIFGNNPKEILKYTDNVLVASIHNRKLIKNELEKAGAKVVKTLDEILNKPVNNSGFNKEYGLLGSNLAANDEVKLFPRDCFELVNKIQTKIKERFNINLEVMIYGDGAFKDPQGGIWELADPVVSPGYTEGLKGTPNELKLKYLASKVESEEKVKELIKSKYNNQTNNNDSLGTTPRQIVDLLGSLADLTSGSGDKGTPFVLIKNYFTNYASE